MLDKKRSYLRLIIASVSSLFILAFAGWLFFNQQYAKDQLSVWAYQIPANVKTVEDRIELTRTGSFYFRTSQPTLAGADTFNQDCPRQEVGSPVLGCYAKGRIYIYNIQNDQLDGIKEVTAAHEMLHAVWERMSPSDQKKIGSLLRTEYAKLIKSDLKDRMDYYARTEPGEFENELHSIIGTEVKDINPELEQYYARLFENRGAVLALHEKYDSVFRSLRAQSDSLFAELMTLGTNIEVRSTQYNADVASLSADIEDFNGRAGGGSFSSIAQFNGERSTLMARSNQLEADRAAINNDIAAYNVKYNQYQKLSIQIESIKKSIGIIGDLEPAPSL
jgi:hypothetical protein